MGKGLLDDDDDDTTPVRKKRRSFHLPSIHLPNVHLPDWLQWYDYIMIPLLLLAAVEIVRNLSSVFVFFVLLTIRLIDFLFIILVIIVVILLVMLWFRGGGRRRNRW